MTIHYHGTPITPRAVLEPLRGAHFCVSHASPNDAEWCHKFGQSVMLDNGAFSKWKTGKSTDWAKYYAWAEEWLSCPTTWAVIPDVIAAGPDAQEVLLKQWPFGAKGAPVWHMDEPMFRLSRLCHDWPRVCIGSTNDFGAINSPVWCRRMDECWDTLSHYRFLPNIHMLRGMRLSMGKWPFASVDSTDIARNHNRPQNDTLTMAIRWDAVQTPKTWALSGNRELVGN